MAGVRKTLVPLLLGLSGLGVAGQAMAGCPTGVNLSGNTNYVQFADGISYSLPILGLDVQSSPGQINDCIVVASGAGGQVSNNALPGLADNAYDDVQGSQNPWFRTGFAGATTTSPLSPFNANNSDPGGAGQFGNDTGNTWDITISALQKYLNGGVPIFYFNHNQTNSGSTIDQDLFAWAQIILRNAAGAAVAVFNFQAVPNTVGPGGTNVPNFGNPTGNVGSFSTGTVVGDAGIVPTSNFVRAGGQICLDGPVGTGNIVPCSDPSAVLTFNENLGADHVANAVLFPEMNALFANNGAGLAGLGAVTMQIDLRLGCLPGTGTNGFPTQSDSTYLNGTAYAGYVPGGGGPGVCPLGSQLNNGYEQLFIVTSAAEFVPEPGTLALLGASLLGLGALRRRGRVAR